MSNNNNNNKHYVMVYGTLKRGGGLHQALQTADFVQESLLSGYKLLNLGGCPGLVAGTNDEHVVGEIYKVDEDTLQDLDRIEGHPVMYTRTEILLPIDLGERGSFTCLYVYIYNTLEEDNSWYTPYDITLLPTVVNEAVGTVYMWSTRGHNGYRSEETVSELGMSVPTIGIVHSSITGAAEARV